MTEYYNIYNNKICTFSNQENYHTDYYVKETESVLLLYIYI